MLNKLVSIIRKLQGNKTLVTEARGLLKGMGKGVGLGGGQSKFSKEGTFHLRQKLTGSTGERREHRSMFQAEAIPCITSESITALWKNSEFSGAGVKGAPDVAGMAARGQN